MVMIGFLLFVGAGMTNTSWRAIQLVLFVSGTVIWFLNLFWDALTLILVSVFLDRFLNCV